VAFLAFLPWLVTVPLLAFFYIGASSELYRHPASDLLSIGGFVALFVYGGDFPRTIELADMRESALSR